MSAGRFNLADYATVAERIQAFWAKYPDGRIHTTLVEYASDHVVMRAEVYTDRADERPVASDYAEEIRSDRGVNSSSMVENCSTSAIGRALANLGMSISKQRPSREEMAKVQRHQDARPAPNPTRPDPDQVLAILGEMDDAREPWHELKRYADEQSHGRGGDDALRIHDKLRTIAARRKAVQPPAGVAG